MVYDTQYYFTKCAIFVCKCRRIFFDSNFSDFNFSQSIDLLMNFFLFFFFIFTLLQSLFDFRRIHTVLKLFLFSFFSSVYRISYLYGIDIWYGSKWLHASAMHIFHYNHLMWLAVVICVFFPPLFFVLYRIVIVCYSHMESLQCVSLLHLLVVRWNSQLLRISYERFLGLLFLLLFYNVQLKDNYRWSFAYTTNFVCVCVWRV